MKTTIFNAALVASCIIVLSAGVCLAQEPSPHQMMQQMMHRNMDAMGQKTNCPNCPMNKKDALGKKPFCPNCPMNQKMPQAMQEKLEREFFLDRQAELGLTAEQVKMLREIRSACRADNIRNGAELKITRLEFAELIEGNAAPEVSEPLVRKIHTLQGDMEVRHLKARQAALQVLTSDQQEKVKGDFGLESLFR